LTFWSVDRSNSTRGPAAATPAARATTPTAAAAAAD